MAHQGYPGLILPPKQGRGRRTSRRVLLLTVWAASLGTILAALIIDPSAQPRRCADGKGAGDSGCNPRTTLPAAPIDTASPRPIVSDARVADRRGTDDAPASAPAPRIPPTDAPMAPAIPPLRSAQPIQASDSIERSTPAPVGDHRRPNTRSRERVRHFAEQGEPFAQYRLAKALHRMGNPREAERWYRQAERGLARLAAAGHGQAQYTLGAMYAFGKGVRRDDDEALRYLTLAAGQGVKPALPLLNIVNRHRASVGVGEGQGEMRERGMDRSASSR